MERSTAWRISGTVLKRMPRIGSFILGIKSKSQGLKIGVYAFFYLIEQHSKFLWHTLQVLYMCTLCDSTNINTKIEFVPNCLQHVSGDGFNGFSDFSAPNGEMHNYCTPHIIKENCENFLIHRCNYILLSQVYCVWQVVKTLTIILNTSVCLYIRGRKSSNELRSSGIGK